MKTFLHFARGAFLALIVAGTLSACDTTSGLEAGTTDEQELEAFASDLTAELSLSSDQSAALTATMSRFGADGVRDPGFLWRLAEELSNTLSDEQKQKLLDRASMRAGGGDRRGRGHGGQRGSQGGKDQRQGGFMSDILTEAQVADLEAIRQARRAEVEEILAAGRTAREAGDREAAQAAMDAIRVIHDEVKAEIEAYLAANLSQEQQDAIAAAQAEREAERAARQAEERAVMEEVLGISSDQTDEILAAVETFREAAGALVRSTDSREAMQALVTDLNGAVAAIIGDDAAFEIFQIHQALASRASRYRRGGAGGGRQGHPSGGGSGG